MSQLTTHVLNTTTGTPAKNLRIVLFERRLNDWFEIASGNTNNDGRLTDLLSAEQHLSPGIYKLHFATKAYFDVQGIETFYPFVDIVFETTGSEHYHVPLLLNPFGYSTYRGS